MRSDKISFKDWISQFKDFDSPMGDFARDVERDKDYPANEETLDILLKHFDSHGRDIENPEVVRLFKIAWTFYKELIF